MTLVVRRCLVFFVLVTVLLGGINTVEGAPAVEGEIYVVSWPSWDVAAWEQVVAVFNETYPNVHVNWTNASSSKYISMVVSGTPLDVMYVNAQVLMNWHQGNYLEDLTPYIKRFLPGFQHSEYVYGNVVYDMKDGKIYALGLEAFPYFYYINKDHFEQNGLAFPVRGWSWHDFLAAAKKLTTPARWGLQSGWSLTRTYPWVWQNGGAIWDESGDVPLINKRETIDGFQFIADLINVHRVVGGNFASQTASMVHTTHANVPRPGQTKFDAFNWGVVVPPRGSVGEAATLNVEGYALMRTSQNKEAAAAFITWAASPIGQRAFAQHLGCLPAHIPTMARYAYLHLDNEKRANVISTISQVAEMGRKSWGSNYEDALAPFNEELNLAFKGEKSVQQAVDASYHLVMSLIEEMKAKEKTK